MFLDEKKNGKSRNIWQMDSFRSAISDSDLFDLGFEGPKFTWKRPKFLNDRIRASSDWALTFASFSELFPDCVVKPTLVNQFDHLALYVYLSYASVSFSSDKRQRPK